MAQGPETEVEAEGATLGEAKWTALHKLRARFPGLSAEAVEFSVLEEGLGDREVRVHATVDVEMWQTQERALPDGPVERVRGVVSRVVSALGVRASVEVDETTDEITATANGQELGILIGRHGATIDALQHLASRAAFKGEEEHKRVVVDAAGYRHKRKAALERAADRAAGDAVAYERAVEMEPMGSQERKVVHTYLAQRGDVATHSEGEGPERRLVVTPSKLGSQRFTGNA
jgi:spoIIIJ-associated protein